MKKVVAVVGLALATVFSVNAMALSVGVVDMQQVFSSAPQLKALQGKLTKQFSGQRAKMIKMLKSLQADQKNLDKNKSVMSTEKLAKLRAKIVSKQSALQLAQTKYQQAIIAAQSKVMHDFIGTVQASAKKVAEKNSLDMVMVNNSVLYAKKTQDVTDKVVADL